MRLAKETMLLIQQKRMREALRPMDIFFSSIAATLVYAGAYACSCFTVRYTSKGLAILGLIMCLFTCIFASLMGSLRWKNKRPARSWVACALLCWACLLAGLWMGNSYWYSHMIKYHTWRDMASYTNIDPDTDKGQSFMDAGTMYFTDGAHVLTDHAVAFRNGAVYCVAPIVKSPIQQEAGSSAPQTVNGFTMPRSGTVDFWAVGTDCCGLDGNSFDCHDSKSLIARSGLRILDETSRSMYLLGVQEWSATTGLPVRHPLFFEWVKDPILHETDLQKTCNFDFIVRVTVCAFGSLVVGSILHNTLQKFRIE